MLQISVVIMPILAHADGERNVALLVQGVPSNLFPTGMAHIHALAAIGAVCDIDDVGCTET